MLHIGPSKYFFRQNKTNKLVIEEASIVFKVPLAQSSKKVYVMKICPIKVAGLYYKGLDGISARVLTAPYGDFLILHSEVTFNFGGSTTNLRDPKLDRCAVPAAVIKTASLLLV